jgi:hypothetical protein
MRNFGYRWHLLQLGQLWLVASPFQRKRANMSRREMRLMIHMLSLLFIGIIFIVVVALKKYYLGF